MKKTMMALCAASLMLYAGCEQEELSRYPVVRVPEFTEDDYIGKLSDPNPEVAYNAVCNLSDNAPGFGRALGGEKKDPASAEYRQAQLVYSKICGLLQSPEPPVVAASLRFLQLFVKDYEPKTELIAPVCQIQSRTPQVQLEQIAMLSLLATNTACLPESLTQRLLASPSWMVSRSTYGLVDQWKDAPSRRELARRYRSATTEQEKLLLLTAFYHEPERDNLEWIQREMLASDSAKIRLAAGELLARNCDSEGVASWLGDHFETFRPEERRRVFNSLGGANEALQTDLACRFLLEGLVLDDDTLQGLNNQLEQKRSNIPAYLARLDQALRSSPAMAARWQKLRAEAEQSHIRLASLQKEYEPLAKEFTEKARDLLTRHNVSTEDQKKFFDSIANVKQITSH